MVSHAGDTWQAMCHNAWQRPMHVGHMAHLKAINMVLFVEGGSSKKEKEGKKKGEGKKGKKERKRNERERRRRKGERKKEKKKRCSDGWNSSNQEVKPVYSTSAMLQEVGILPTLVSFYPLSYCFGLLLGPCCAMFMACFVVLIGIWPIL